MRRPIWERLERPLQLLVGLLSALFLLAFLYTAARRMRYPFELDRMESAMMASVWRLRQGRALYGPPTLEWCAFLYAPLFFYISAALSHVTGVGYQTLRLVSALSTVGTAAVVMFMVRLEGRRWLPGIAAAGLFLSLYPMVYGWYDVGRVDSLSVFFFSLALFSLRRWNPLITAILWLLAFQTKQTFLPIALASFLVDWRLPKRMALGMGSFAVLAWGSFRIIDHATNHWYSFYTVGAVGELGWNPRVLALFPASDLLAPWPVVAVMILAAFLWKPMVLRERDGSFYAIVTLLIVGAVWFVRGHEGANINASIPLFAWLAVLFGVGVQRLLSTDVAARSTSAAPLQRQIAVAVWLAIAVQLAAHIYRPGELIPTHLADREAFLLSLKNTPGDVWLTDHPYDSILAKKPLHPDMDAFDSVLGRHYTPALNEVTEAFLQHKFAAIVFDRQPETYSPKGLFTSSQFRAGYPLETMAPGSNSNEPDQPKYVMIPGSPLSGLDQPGLLGTSLGVAPAAPQHP